MKKVLSIILMISIILSAFSSFTVFSESEYIVQFSKEAEFIRKLEIISDSFDAQSKLTRGEFASLILKMLKIQSGGNNTGYAYSDVPSTHMYYADILTCKQLGAVSASSNNFRPDDVVTANEAITMLINILGYRQYAESFGSYPAGYLQAAKQYNLLNGVSLAGVSEVHGDLAAKLIYNALFLKVVQLDYITEQEGRYSIYEENDYLYNIYEIYMLDAIVVSNGLCTLEGQNSYFDDRVILKDIRTKENVNVFIDNGEILDYPGMRVKAYIKYDDGLNSLFHYEYKEENILTIDAETITSVNNNYIEYEPQKDSGIYKKASYTMEKTVVLYNGMAINTFNNNIMKPKDGYLELTDNDNDGRYDVISIISFNFRGETDRYGYITQDKPAWNIVVDNVDPENYYINCKLNPSVNNIDLSENKAIYRFTKRSSAKSLSEIVAGNIVSVALAPQKADNKNVYLLTVSDTEITDTVLSREDDSIICANGRYVISSSVTNSSLSRIEYDSSITFMTDTLGKIAYISKSGGVTNNYGYLISAEPESSVDSVLKVKMFTKDGKVEIYDVAAKCIIDGAVKTSSAGQKNAITARSSDASKMSADTYYSRPVIYTLNNDGLINMIDTDNPNDNVNGKRSDSIYADHSPINYSDEESEERNALKAGHRIVRSAKYKTRTSSFEGRFFINSDTVIISVPDIDTYGLDKTADYLGTGAEGAYTSNVFDYNSIKLCENDREDENYKILSISELSQNYYYDAQAYDVDPETGVASLLILRGKTDIYAIGAYLATNPLYVFLKMTKFYDSTIGKNVYKLYYTRDGVQEESGTVDPDTLFEPYSYIIFGTQSDKNPYSLSTPALKKGDIIRVEKKGDAITHIDRPLILDKIDNGYSLLAFPESRKNWYSSGTTNEYNTATLPFDMRNETTTNISIRELHLVKPKSVSSGVLAAYSGTGTLSGINLSNQTTYTLNYYNLANSKIVLIENNAGDIRVSEGNITDINPAKSKILVKEYDFDIEQIFVFN